MWLAVAFVAVYILALVNVSLCDTVVLVAVYASITLLSAVVGCSC